MSFFLSFNPILISHNLHQLCITTIFSDMKQIKTCGGAHFFASSQTVASLDLPQVVFLSASFWATKSGKRATKSRGDDLSRLHGFECNLHIAGGKLLRWRRKMNSSWMNFRSRYSLNRSKLRLCWRKDEFRRISLWLLHFLTVLHYFNPSTYMGVRYQRESRGRQKKRTLDSSTEEKKLNEK